MVRVKLIKQHSSNMTDPHTPKYEWQEGGRELLRVIQERIKFYGGNLVLHKAMIKETRPILTMPNTEVETSRFSVIYNMWPTHTLDQIAAKIGCSYQLVYKHAQRLGLTKNHKQTGYKFDQRLKQTYWVLNKQTGIYYENIVRASESIGMHPGVLNKRLHGKAPNKTALIIV